MESGKVIAGNASRKTSTTTITTTTTGDRWAVQPSTTASSSSSTKPPMGLLVPGSVNSFAQYSFGSLPTNCLTRDSLPDGEICDDDEESSKSVSTMSACGSGPGDLTTLVEASPRTPLARGASTSFRTSTTLSEAEFDCVDSCGDTSLPPAPLLDVEGGFKPLTEHPTVPPTSWLTAAGFQVVPGRMPFEHAPVAPVYGARPTTYLNLFCRQMLRRGETSPLTAQNIAVHNQNKPALRHVAANDILRFMPGEEKWHSGEWLEAFKVSARARMLRVVTTQILDTVLGGCVAEFLDQLSVSDTPSEMDNEDAPNGYELVGQCTTVRPVEQGSGRAGFLMEQGVAVPYPGELAYYSLRPEQAMPPVELPTPPLLLGPGQESRAATLRIQHTLVV